LAVQKAPILVKLSHFQKQSETVSESDAIGFHCFNIANASRAFRLKSGFIVLMMCGR
jgi:uncharacterized membrane protein YeiH